MKKVYVRRLQTDVPATLLRALKIRAAERGTTMQAETRRILIQALKPEPEIEKKED